MYHFYYLPYQVQQGYGFYNKDYLKPEAAPKEDWLNRNQLLEATEYTKLPLATLLEIQARTSFDSFFPMEVIALDAEKEKLKQLHKQVYLIFPESRKFPVRMNDELPQRWIQRGPSRAFSDTAQKNEYFAFQLGIFASQKELNNVKVVFSDLENGMSKIPASSLTCFNTGGVDPYGKTFEKRVDIKKDYVQPLWIGVDIPEHIQAGNYKGFVTLSPENAPDERITISLTIENRTISDRGDSERWRHSRLRWLNSKRGIDDQTTRTYKPIKVLDDEHFELSGKNLKIGKDLLPGSMNVYGTEILEEPITFTIETNKVGKEQFENNNSRILSKSSGIIKLSGERYSDRLVLHSQCEIEADGYLNYQITLEALTDIDLKDIRLEIPLRKEMASYMMGMGLPGTKVPEKHNSKWKGPHDSFWIGNEQAGIWCEFRGSNYHGPLLNLYHPAYPESWYNGNKGGFQLHRDQATTNIMVYSGPHTLKAKEKITFEWSLLLTPVKKIDYHSQFQDRYFQNVFEPLPPDDDLRRGVKIVNLHHANEFNPHINYPFVDVDNMKSFVDEMHQKGAKVKIYYTVRELTNYTSELWALRSLGNEVLGDGKGGGYPWLREHLVDGYRPQWYQYFPDKSADASIVNASGDSRWYNYYIEGLAWLVKNVDIDGLYLDDVTYDRRILKRIRKVLDTEKAACLLDLHSNTGFSKGPAIQYAEFFPYIDKLWFGESFNYDEMSPENWLVEVSGIPFGLMGDMLHRGGNRWLGMLFGMTVRHPWLTDGITCDPRPVWEIWDSFGIHESKMVGFWEANPLVTTNHPDVKATVYLKEDKMLIALGNFTDQLQAVALTINWANTELNKNKIKLICPEIRDFQSASVLTLEDSIPIEARKGLLILVE